MKKTHISCTSIRMIQRILFLVAFCATATACGGESLKSQLDTPLEQPPEAREDNEYRILFIGDSITRHGTNAAVREKLGWGHVAGMAASEEAKDYVHLLADKIDARREEEVSIYFHTAGGGGSVAQRLGSFDHVVAANPDLVVIQLGEHEKQKDGTGQLRRDFAALIEQARSFPTKPEVICVGPWSPTNETSRSNYNGWAGDVEAVMREVATENGVAYVSVRTAAENPANSGWGESDGVRWHPNDAGHAAYAERIFEAYLLLSER